MAQETTAAKRCETCGRIGACTKLRRDKIIDMRGMKMEDTPGYCGSWVDGQKFLFEIPGCVYEAERGTALKIYEKNEETGKWIIAEGAVPSAACVQPQEGGIETLPATPAREAIDFKALDKLIDINKGRDLAKIEARIDIAKQQTIGYIASNVIHDFRPDRAALGRRAANAKQFALPDDWDMLHKGQTLDARFAKKTGAETLEVNSMYGMNVNPASGEASIKFSNNGVIKWVVGKGPGGAGESYGWYNVAAGSNRMLLQENGILDVLNTLQINPAPAAYSYNEGLRIARAGNSWCNIQIGTEASMRAGYITGQWIVGSNPGKDFVLSQCGKESTVENGLKITPNNAAAYFNSQMMYHRGNLQHGTAVPSLADGYIFLKHA